MWVRIKIKDVTQYEYITWIEQILCCKQIQKTDLYHFFFFTKLARNINRDWDPAGHSKEAGRFYFHAGRSEWDKE